MTEQQAMAVRKEIEELCHRHGLWSTIVEEKRPVKAGEQPRLFMIRVQEISIKVDRAA